MYGESWNFCSQLKTSIRAQVRNLKSIFPDSFTGTGRALQLQISDTVKSLVGDGSYLHDSVPGSVCISTTNPRLGFLTHSRINNSILLTPSSLPPRGRSTSTSGSGFQLKAKILSRGLFPSRLLLLLGLWYVGIHVVLPHSQLTVRTV